MYLDNPGDSVLIDVCVFTGNAMPPTVDSAIFYGTGYLQPATEKRISAGGGAVATFNVTKTVNTTRSVFTYNTAGLLGVSDLHVLCHAHHANECVYTVPICGHWASMYVPCRDVGTGRYVGTWPVCMHRARSCAPCALGSMCALGQYVSTCVKCTADLLLHVDISSCELEWHVSNAQQSVLWWHKGCASCSLAGWRSPVPHR